jgi:hypothetical protein
MCGSGYALPEAEGFLLGYARFRYGVLKIIELSRPTLLLAPESLGRSPKIKSILDGRAQPLPHIGRRSREEWRSRNCVEAGGARPEYQETCACRKNF